MRRVAATVLLAIVFGSTPLQTTAEFAPTLAAEDVRRYATAGVLVLAMRHAARLPAWLSRSASGPATKLPR